MQQPFFNPYLVGTVPTGPYGNSALLNEIHNYFPALLYDNNRFRGIHDVFYYVEAEMRNRFDTFSVNQRQYRANTMPQRRTVTPVFTGLFQREIVIDETEADLLNHIFRGFTDPVPVVPTTLDVQRGSSIHQVTASPESPCAICQDVIAVGNIVRKLRGCNHIFHLECIDTWFNRNVSCPTCRHDIRTAVPVLPSTGTTSPQRTNS